MRESRKLVALALMALLYPAAYALLGVAQGLAQVRPETPWDAALITEAWRMAQGLPLYEPGRASTMYGFGYPSLLASIFYWTGPSLLIPELISLVSGGLILLMAGAAVQPYLGKAGYILAGLSIVALDVVFTYYKMSRPDLIAWAFGFGSLLIFYRADAGRSLRLYLAGSALLVMAAAFKQTAGTIAVIPPAVVLATAISEQKWPSGYRLFLAVIPGLSGLIFITALKALNPLAYYFMINVPAQYSIDMGILGGNLWSFAAGAICLYIALAMRLSLPIAMDEEWKRRVLWSAVSFAVMLPLAQIIMAKAGGAPNSLIPASLTLIVLTLLLVGGVRRRELATAMVAIGIMFMTMPFPRFLPLLVGEGPRTDLNAIRGTGEGNRASREIGEGNRAYRVVAALTARLLRVNRKIRESNRAYREVVALTARLDGPVVSPEDPTITLFARSQADESIYFRTDEVRWPTEWPDDIDATIKGSAYIVDTRDWWADLVNSPRLLEAGFSPVWTNSHYVIWRNARTTDPA